MSAYTLPDPLIPISAVLDDFPGVSREHAVAVIEQANRAVALSDTAD
jgi:hypothetical protein